jgi:hypothetical protein
MTSPGGVRMSFELKEILNDVEGATAVEYGLIASLFGSPLQNLLGSVLAVVIGVTS